MGRHLPRPLQHPRGRRDPQPQQAHQGRARGLYEFELFEVHGETVHLQPFPGGKKVDGFQLQSHDSKARKATFENPDKDYPTRIVYHRPSDDELVITLTDPHGGSDKVEQFELSR